MPKFIELVLPKGNLVAINVDKISHVEMTDQFGIYVYFGDHSSKPLHLHMTFENFMSLLQE